MSSSLEPDQAERALLANQIAAFLDDWMERAATMPGSGTDLSAEEIASLMTPPSEEGRSLESILDDVELAGKAGHIHLSGGHLSYIPNSGMYTAALAEFLAAGLNRYTGVASAAPGMTAIEHATVDWMTSLFDLGPSASGLLLSGGSMANFTAIVAARTAKLGDELGKGVLYVSGHTHHSVAKAARLAGFRNDQIRVVPVDRRPAHGAPGTSRHGGVRPRRWVAAVPGGGIGGHDRHRDRRPVRPNRRRSLEA